MKVLFSYIKRFVDSMLNLMYPQSEYPDDDDIY